MYLVEPKSIEGQKEKRRIANYYSLVTDGESQMTISNMKLNRGLMSFAMKVAGDSATISM